MFSLIITCPFCTGDINNLIEAVSFSSLKPEEIIIVTRKEVNIKVYQNRFRFKLIKPNDKTALSAAAIRNLGATEASSSILMFLQKDYLPNSEYFKEQVNFFKENNGIITGIKNNSFPHSPTSQFSLLSNAEEFNGRNFMIKKEDFDLLNGFDDAYFGEGVEDIDFAFAAKEKGISIFINRQPIKYVNTEVYRLPLNQFLPIIDNCEIFKQKWNKYPMKKCLKAFKDKKLINWNEQDEGRINIIRFPSFEMIEKEKLKVNTLSY